MKGLSTCHFSQHIKRTHLIPFCHIDAIRLRWRLFTNDLYESIDDSADNRFLLKEGTLRKRRRQHSAHLTMPMWVSLATNATSTEPGAKNIIERGFDRHRLIRNSVPIYCLPWLDRSKRKLIRGYAYYVPWSTNSVRRSSRTEKLGKELPYGAIPQGRGEFSQLRYA